MHWSVDRQTIAVMGEGSAIQDQEEELAEDYTGLQQLCTHLEKAVKPRSRMIVKTTPRKPNIQ